MSIKFPYRGSLLAVLAATVATSSCGGGGGGGGTSGPSAMAPPNEPIVATRPVTQSDLEIARSLYAGTPRTPHGFYTDPAQTEEDFVSTEHLKNNDVDTAVSDAEPVFELCTDDWNEALTWSELNAQSASVYADLVETNEAPRYFEFGRTRVSEPQFYVRERVFKCAYVDRSSADLRKSEGAAGLFNKRPLTAEDLKTFSEYVWSFTPYNNFGNAVLKSSGTSNSSALTHTLHIATLDRHAISSTCDRIHVLAWRHTADATTGELMLDVESEFSFGARESGGVVELCEII